jgi:hypothetical protein
VVHSEGQHLQLQGLGQKVIVYVGYCAHSGDTHSREIEEKQNTMSIIIIRGKEVTFMSWPRRTVGE